MKKKGFTLIELVIVVALVGILLSVASLSMKKTIEDRAVEEAKTKISETMRSYVERSYNEGREYTIAIANGTLTVLDGDKDSTDEVENIILPEMLKYIATMDGVSIDNGVKISTDGENVEDAEEMIISISVGDEEPRYTIKMWKKGVTELMDVNVIKAD